MQVFELYTKLKYILEQKSLSDLPTTIRWISILAAVAILLSLAILPIFSILSRNIFKEINWDKLYYSDAYKQSEEDKVRQTESIYGYVSGSEFLLLSILFVILFTKLTRMLNKSELLSDQLKSQRKELTIFWVTVFFGYGIRTLL